MQKEILYILFPRNSKSYRMSANILLVMSDKTDEFRELMII
jgi:hypothetical protein